MVKSTKGFFQANSVYEAVGPVLSAARLGSSIPFKFHVQKGCSKTSLSFRYTISGIMYVTLYTLCFVLYAFYPRELADRNIQPIYVYTEKFQMYTGFITFFSTFIFRFIKCNNLAIFFEYVMEIDNSLEKLNHERNYVKLKKFFYLSVFKQQSIYILYMIYVTYFSPLMEDLKDIPVGIVKYLPTYSNILVQYTCSALIYLILLSLKAFVDVITKLFPLQDSRILPVEHIKPNVIFRVTSSQTDKKAFLEKLSLISEGYSKICDAGFMLNEYFSITMFAVLSGGFLNMLFNTFYVMMFISYYNVSDKNPVEEFSVAIVQFIVNCLNMIMLVYVCNACEIQCKEMAQLINKLMAYEEDEDISNKLHVISTHMLHNSTKFTAAGLFSINNTLHFTVIGAITTYMIILFQFSPPDQNTNQSIHFV